MRIIPRKKTVLEYFYTGIFGINIKFFHSFQNGRLEHFWQPVIGYVFAWHDYFNHATPMTQLFDNVPIAIVPLDGIKLYFASGENCLVAIRAS